VSDRPRILVVGTPGSTSADWVRRYAGAGEVVAIDSLNGALELLRHDCPFDVVLANPTDTSLRETVRTLFQANQILAAIPDGIAVVDFDLKIRWANPTFEGWCGGSAVGRGFYEALGSPRVTGPDFCPFHTALTAAVEPQAPRNRERVAVPGDLDPVERHPVRRQRVWAVALVAVQGRRRERRGAARHHRLDAAAHRHLEGRAYDAKLIRGQGARVGQIPRHSRRRSILHLDHTGVG